MNLRIDVAHLTADYLQIEMVCTTHFSYDWFNKNCIQFWLVVSDMLFTWDEAKINVILFRLRPPTY